MAIRTTVMLVALTLAPGSAAAEPCPAWRERQTMACMRGYLRVDPAGLWLAIAGGTYAPRGQVGYLAAVSGGVFRAFPRVALAAGGRASYGLFHAGRETFTVTDHYVHVGPELRVGRAAERVFGYFVVRGGYSQWRTDIAYRLSVAPSGDHGGHYGLGGGAWGRIGRRLLLGGEVVFDFVHLSIDDRAMPSVGIALTLGAWL